MSGQSENVSHAHRECMKLRDRVKELEVENAALRAQAQAEAGEIEALRDEHEALRTAENGSHPANRRLRVCIENLVYELELHQRNVEHIGYMRQRVEQARGKAALAQADAQDGPQ